MRRCNAFSLLLLLWSSRLKIFHGESRYEAGESGQQEYHSQNDDIALPVGHAGQYARMR
jgi:hypothetical protein